MATRRQILDSLLVSLEPVYGLRETKSISAIVVEGLLGWSRMDCVIDADSPVEISPEQAERMEQIRGELMRCRPVQYVMGTTEFWGLQFDVREGVLIPRPETEELIDWIVSQSGAKSEVKLGFKSRFKSVLDIGTGSGAIAISLSHELGRESRVAAIDISDDALEIAQGNARKNGVEVEFAKVDILSPDPEWLESRRYDLIVSNPPYIPNSDRSSMRKNVLDYEPHIALFVEDDDPLIFYRTIAAHGQKLLNPGGWIYFEIYETLADELIEMVVTQGYTSIELKRDVNDKARMIRCQKSLQ